MTDTPLTLIICRLISVVTFYIIKAVPEGSLILTHYVINSY